MPATRNRSTAMRPARPVQSRSAASRRRAEDVERAAGRDLEAAAREAAWHASQAERLALEAERAAQALAGGRT